MKLGPFGWAGELERMRSAMGAALIRNSPIVDWNKLQTRGYDIALTEVVPDNRGLLTWKGSYVVVYIREWKMGAKTSPKFHVAECKTLTDARGAQRFDSRYVVSTRSDGLYTVTRQDTGQDADERLDVCMNCLDRLNWKGFSSLSWNTKKQTVTEFQPAILYIAYGVSQITPLPKRTDSMVLRTGYTPDWPTVSDKKREAAGWICEQCAFDAREPDRRRFLHVHHRDADTQNNQPENLRVLCVACHAEQPLHGHLKAQPEFVEFVRRFRT